MLLMALPPAAAAELLKSAPPEAVMQIAAELAYLKSGNAEAAGEDDPLREFVTQLGGRSGGKKDFVRGLLENVVGKAKLDDTMRQVQKLVDERDPFMPIRKVDVRLLAQALSGESAGVVALVLSELPAKMGATILPLLDKQVHDAAVRGMAASQEVSLDARAKVAAVIRARLEQFSQKPGAVVSVGTDRKQEKLRKVALVLRGLEKSLRDQMVKSITEHDKDSADAVLRLMVTWEDMTLIPDRTLQEILRTVDARKLALAMMKVDPVIARKIRGNMSERAVALVDEETSLLSKPKADDITASREVILDALRAINAKGELVFEEEAANGA
jgi:flagellar motor switch protein FliG